MEKTKEQILNDLECKMDKEYKNFKAKMLYEVAYVLKENQSGLEAAVLKIFKDSISEGFICKGEKGYILDKDIVYENVSKYNIRKIDFNKFIMLYNVVRHDKNTATFLHYKGAYDRTRRIYLLDWYIKENHLKKEDD